MALRDEIAMLLLEADPTDDPAPVAGERARLLADAILALPQIAEALAEAEATKRFRRTIGHSVKVRDVE